MKRQRAHYESRQKNTAFEIFSINSRSEIYRWLPPFTSDAKIGVLYHYKFNVCLRVYLRHRSSQTNRSILMSLYCLKIILKFIKICSTISVVLTYNVNFFKMSSNSLDSIWVCHASADIKCTVECNFGGNPFKNIQMILT